MAIAWQVSLPLRSVDRGALGENPLRDIQSACRKEAEWNRQPSYFKSTMLATLPNCREGEAQSRSPQVYRGQAVGLHNLIRQQPATAASDSSTAGQQESSKNAEQGTIT